MMPRVGHLPRVRRLQLTDCEDIVWAAIEGPFNGETSRRRFRIYTRYYTSYPSGVLRVGGWAKTLPEAMRTARFLATHEYVQRMEQALSAAGGKHV